MSPRQSSPLHKKVSILVLLLFAALLTQPLQRANAAAWETYSSPIVGSYVQDMVYAGGELYIGGIFTTASGVTVNNFAKYDDGTSAFVALGSGTTGEIKSLVAVGTDIYMAGTFTDAGGVADTAYFAKYDTLTGIYSSLGAGTWTTAIPTIAVYDLAYVNNRVYIIGNFNQAAGTAANNFAYYDIGGGTFNSAGTGLDFFGTALAVDGNDVYAGGLFTSAGGVADTFCVAVWSDTGSTWASLGVDAATNVGMGNVRTFDVVGGNLYMGGSFTDLEGIADADNIAYWDGVSWNAVGTGVDAGILSITHFGTDLYVGGSFTNINSGPVANRVAKWDGSAWSGLGLGVGNNTVTVVYTDDTVLTDPSIFVGGTFTDVEGGAATYFARFDDFATTPTLSSTAPALNDTLVDVTSNLTATFSTDITLNLGQTLSIKKVSDNSTVESFTVAFPRTTVSESGATVTLNPVSSLPSGEELYVEISASAIQATSGSTPFAGISGSGTWAFHTMPSLEFSSSTATLAENAGTTTFDLAYISSSSASTATVNVNISGGTATDVTDYSLTTGTTSGINALTSIISLPITIIDDTDDEGDETIFLTLSSPVNVDLTVNTTLIITITDDDSSAGGTVSSGGGGGKSKYPTSFVELGVLGGRNENTPKAGDAMLITSVASSASTSNSSSSSQVELPTVGVTDISEEGSSASSNISTAVTDSSSTDPTEYSSEIYATSTDGHSNLNLGSCSPSFAIKATYNGRNNPEKIRELQTFLNTQGEDLPITGLFHRSVVDAVKRFELAHGLPELGIWDSPEHDIASQIACGWTAPKFTVPILTCETEFTKTLRIYALNDLAEVKKLQSFLASLLNIDLSITGFFGPATETAVKDFQTLYSDEILKPIKLTQPTGFFGPYSIAQANKLCAN